MTAHHQISSRKRKRAALALLCSMSLACILFETTSAQDRNTLRPASAFASIPDRDARSRALFTEAAKVITHPRCMNCHPASDSPLQGDNGHIHQPAAYRGEGGDGIPGLHCSACHSDRNFTLMEGASYQSIPGNSRWGLAPIEMAWQGKSIGQICEQLKDAKRNGGRSLALLQEHMAKDDVVAHGWDPGAGRKPAPGTQAEFGELIKAWIETGAECPAP
jgi:hypothetical protein